MTYEQIEAFLSVVTYGTFSAAADYLYISQSTISSRILQLESELNVQLFNRQKGHKHAELTEYGIAFIPLASQWASLWKNTQNLSTLSTKQRLVISSIDTVNNHTLVPLFNDLLKTEPEIKLTINTYHSHEIHELVQSRTADIGFVFSEASYPDIISRPVYRELMYLACRKDSPYHDDISCDELDPSEEIFLNWGQDYKRWHELHWGVDKYNLIQVNTGSTMLRFFTENKRWSIAPMSVIKTFMESKDDMTYYRLKEPPAPRICYEITNRFPNLGQQRVIDIFNQKLTEFIANSDSVCSFESWMLASI